MESQEGGKEPFSPCIPIGDRTVAWLGGQYKVLCPFALRQKGHESTCMYIHVYACKTKPMQLVYV